MILKKIFYFILVFQVFTQYIMCNETNHSKRDLELFNSNYKKIVKNAILTIVQTPSLYEPIKFSLMIEISPEFIKEIKVGEYVFQRTAFLAGMTYYPQPLFFATYDKDIIKYFINNPKKIVVVNGEIRDMKLRNGKGEPSPMFVISSLHTDNKSIDLPKDEIIHGDNYHITKHLLEDEGYTYTINGTCEIVFNSLQRLKGSRNCKRKTNSKKQEIYCTIDMKVCKTQDEIINKVKLNFPI